MLLGFGAAYLAGLLVVFFRERLLPAKFSYDGRRIQEIAATGRSDGWETTDASYSRVATFYRILGLEDHPLVAGVLGFTLFAACCWLVLHKARYSVSWAPALMMLATLLLGAVYLGYFSKEVIALGVTAYAITADRLRRIAVLVLLILLYAYLFRSYWVVVGLLMILYLIVLRVFGRYAGVALAASTFLALAAAGAAYPWLLGDEISSIRETVNAGRLGSPDAVTLIGTYVSGDNTFFEIINLITTWVLLVLPIPLLLLGGLYYWGIFVLIVGIWGLFGWSALKLRSSSQSLSHTEGGGGWHAVLLAYPLAFLTTQALFEPDYGSALRHLTPILPCMLMAIFLHYRAGRNTVRPWPVERRA